MATLVLNELTCNQTEDNAGSDECELRIWCDSRFFTMRKDLTNGETWPLNGWSQPFERRVKIQLWDLDNPGFPLYDDHDRLGTAIVYPDVTSDGQASFNEDGSDYELHYEVR
jgi:hypothetical protein